MAIEAISQTGGGAGTPGTPTSSTSTPNTGSVAVQPSATINGNPTASQFDNTIKTTEPYQWEVPINGQIDLYGVYLQNKIEFDRIDLSKIKKVPDTNFRFILVIRNNIWDTNPTLYTSERYYIDLEYALLESNPYFTLQSFNRPFVVEVSIDDIMQKVRDLRSSEYKLGVEVYQSLMMNQSYISGSVDNTSERVDHYPLIKYIDWLVSPRNGLDDTYNSVLPVWEIGKTNFDYYYADYDGIEPPSGSDDANDGGDNTPPPPTYPPVGRPGDYIDEIVTSSNGLQYIWKIESGVGIWKFYDPDLGNVGTGGGPGGGAGGPGGGGGSTGGPGPV